MSDYKKLILILRKEKLYYAFKQFVYTRLRYDYCDVEYQIVEIMLNNKDNFLSVIQGIFNYSPDTILSYILTSMYVTTVRRARIIELFKNF